MSSTAATTTHRLFPLFCVALGCILCAPTQADALDLRASAAIGAANAQPTSQFAQWGFAGQLDIDASINDFWGIHAGLEGAYHLRREGTDPITPASTVANAWAGVRYNFDVFAYVPYIGLAAVGYLNAPPTTAPNEQATAPGAGAKLTMGLLWRPRRSWSYGASIDLHGAVPALTNFGLWATLTFRIAYHWRL